MSVKIFRNNARPDWMFTGDFNRTRWDVEIGEWLDRAADLIVPLYWMALFLWLVTR